MVSEENSFNIKITSDRQCLTLSDGNLNVHIKLAKKSTTNLLNNGNFASL